MRAYLVLAVVGCSVPPPFYGLETPRTLPSGQLLVAAGGGGGIDQHGNGYGGGAARVRVGIGSAQEVGVDVAALSTGDTWTEGAKAAYKVMLADKLAFAASLGGSLSLAVPVGADDRYALGGITETATVPLGLAWTPLKDTPNLRILAELGPLAGLAQHRNGNAGVVTDDYYGAYGAAVLAWTH